MRMPRRSVSVRKLQRALITTVLDGAGAGSAKICCVLMRGARADMFGCASHREIFQLLQKLPSWQPKKPDRYWCAPVRTPAVRKAPVISGKEVGYVRRSEFGRNGSETERAFKAFPVGEPTTWSFRTRLT